MLVEALSAIDAKSGLSSDWHVALNKLSDLGTMIHQAEKESKAKPGELGHVVCAPLQVLRELPAGISC